MMGAVVPDPLNETEVAVDAQSAPVVTMGTVAVFGPELVGVKLAVAPARDPPGGRVTGAGAPG
jgi:hypothetical protein